MSNFEDFLFVDREKKLRGFEKLLRPETRQAVMVIEAGQDMGKTWLVGKMQRHCLQADVRLPAAQIDFRNPREIHEIQDMVAFIRLLRNKLEHPSYFNHLNATINSFSTTDLTIQGGSGLPQLQNRIEAHFNLDELEGLAFDLEIRYENLRGETLQAKTIALVSYCHRRRIIPRLVTQCETLRPEIDWWTGLESFRETAASSATPSLDINAAFIEDNNALLRADSDMERRHAERQINNAFFDCLIALMNDKQPIVFLFDSYEAAPPDAQRWLAMELLPRLRDGLLDDVVIIITGRKTPDLTDLNMKHLIVQTGLQTFNENYVREYFEQRREITGLDLRTIMATSGGVPGALAMMADHAMVTSEEDDDFFSDL